MKNRRKLQAFAVEGNGKTVHVDMKIMCCLAGEEQARRKQQLASVQKQSEALQKGKNSSEVMRIFTCAGLSCSNSA